MGDLDGLIDSRISLITHNDEKYEGTLFSINATESSMVLKDVRCLGTEDRVNDPAKKVPASNDVVAFVTFPGMDIKDLLVHDTSSENTADTPPPPPAPAVSKSKAKGAQPPKPPAQKANVSNTREKQKGGEKKASGGGADALSGGGRGGSGRGVGAGAPSGRGRGGSAGRSGGDAAASDVPSAGGRSGGGGRGGGRSGGGAAGTGAHLLRMRERKAGEAGSTDATIPTTEDFDFAAGLSVFKKEDVYAKVATEAASEGANIPLADEITYKKDDFFDSLSCDMTDRQAGRRTRLSAAEERTLNQDTFGAIALQSNYRRGYRGGGRGGGYRGRGDGGRGRGGRGRGRGGRSNSTAATASA